jgi:hypothetical protein
VQLLDLPPAGLQLVPEDTDDLAEQRQFLPVAALAGRSPIWCPVVGGRVRS